MQIHFTILFSVAALVASVIADDSSECDTGSIQCCTNTYSSSDSAVTELLDSLNLGLPDLSGLVGTSCSPISALGTDSGADCTQQPVCCTDNQFNGLINFGCSPVNINL